MKKYILFCLLILLAQNVHAQIFADDFEGWTSTSSDSWGTKYISAGGISTDTAVYQLGQYSMKIEDISTTQQNVYITKSNLSIQSTAYCRMYIYLDDGFQESRSTGRFIWSLNAPNYNSISLTNGYSGGRNCFYTVTSPALAYCISTMTVYDNRWYCIEIKIPSCTVNATPTFWINEEQQPMITKDLTICSSYANLSVGMQYTASNTSTQTIHFDNLYIDNNPIGRAAGDDVTPPSAITNFTATAISNSDIQLSWQTPGDDGMITPLPPGSSYYIQYNTVTVLNPGWNWRITSQNGYNVSIATNGISPGTIVNYTVSGLDNTANYYFRIWAMDERFNWSTLSTGATMQWAFINKRKPKPQILGY